MNEPIVLPVPAPGERCVAFGDSGSGKTTVLRSLFRAVEHGIAIDTKHDGELEDLGTVVKGDKIFGVGPGRYVWRPSDSYVTDLAQRERFFTWALRAGNRTIYIDELGDTCESTQSYPNALRMAVTRGRSRHLSIWGTTQEPVRVPTFLFGQSPYVYVFACSYPSHQRLAEQIYGVPIDFSTIPWRSYKFFLKTPQGRFGPLGPLQEGGRR